jgi:glutamine amidotransferase
MGWNRVEFLRPALSIPTDDYFYFVNSYHAVPADPDDIWGVADYPLPFAAAVARGNILATQFHAEKSGAAGLGLLRGFAALGQGETC